MLSQYYKINHERSVFTMTDYIMTDSYINNKSDEWHKNCVFIITEPSNVQKKSNLILMSQWHIFLKG